MSTSTIEIKVPEESHEGTTMKVQSWLKQSGELVKQFEPIVEMETDKVTLEIEAPEEGVIAEILIAENIEVEPGAVLGIIRLNDGSVNLDADENSQDQAVSVSKHVKQSEKSIRNIALSPAVRRFVAKHDLDAAQILGSGKNGRVTLKDAKAFLGRKGVNNDSAPEKSGAEVGVTDRDSVLIEQVESVVNRKLMHTPMRRSIAQHMVSSVQESPHVTSVFELDFTAISAHRAKYKSSFAERGVKLTYTAYFLRACVLAMQTVPQINSRWHDDYTEMFSDINIGIGTALGERGLVVPVISRTQEKSLFGLAKELQEITNKARNNKIKADDMRGGTFTISNHGVSGSLLATPVIINQPQSAILGVGALEKRVVVREVDGHDAILIRPMAYVSLTIDHRVVDGFQTNQWLSAFVETLENWSE